MLTQQLRDYWSKQGIMVAGGNSSETIGAFEAKWHVLLPLDMRDYFSRIGGMAENEVDPETLMYFWPLHELVPVTEQMPDWLVKLFNGYVEFADWSIHALVYGINLAPGSSGYGSVATYNGDKLIPVAPSFTEFVRIYLTEPYRLP